MSVDIPSIELSAQQEASIYLNLVDKDPFTRGFLQVIQTVVPAPPEGPLLLAAAEFIADDKDRFEKVKGMSDIFESDDYALGVVLGIKAYREKARIQRGEVKIR